MKFDSAILLQASRVQVLKYIWFKVVLENVTVKYFYSNSCRLERCTYSMYVWINISMRSCHFDLVFMSN